MVHRGVETVYVGWVIAGAMLIGLAGAVILGFVAGSDAGVLPGVALGSFALLVAERSAVFFGIWMVMVVVVVRTFRNQLPIEISGRGVRYAEVEEVQVKTASVDDALRAIDGEMRWLRDSVIELQEAQENRRRTDGA